MATSKRKKRTSTALAGTLSAFSQPDEQSSAAAEMLPDTADLPSVKADEIEEPLPTEQPPSSPPPKDTSPSKTVPPKKRFNQLTQQLSQYWEQPEQPITVEQLRSWLETLDEQLPAQPILQDWLTNWSSAEITQFTQQWLAYCRGLGFDLRWVINQLLPDTALQTELQEAALAYISLYQQVLSQQTEIDQFRAYELWRKQIDSPKYERLNQHLFIKLTHLGFILAPPIEVYCADMKTRVEYMQKALLQVADNHLAEFLKALTEALS